MKLFYPDGTGAAWFDQYENDTNHLLLHIQSQDL